MKKILVWDLPTRLFHWLLAAAIGAAWATGEAGGSWMIWHGRIGLLIIGLVVFRLAWGFVGSTYARFSTFVRGPAAIRNYLRGQWRGIGHNPLGALSVLALLAVTAVQAGSGLFAANDDIGYTGFLYSLASDQLAALAHRVHHQAFNVLLALVALHVAAILYYVHVKRDNLLKPMIVGTKASDDGEPARGGGFVAFVVALAVALAAVGVASGIWITKPAPAATTPSW